MEETYPCNWGPCLSARGEHETFHLQDCFLIGFVILMVQRCKAVLLSSSFERGWWAEGTSVFFRPQNYNVLYIMIVLVSPRLPQLCTSLTLSIIRVDSQDVLLHDVEIGPQMLQTRRYSTGDLDVGAFYFTKHLPDSSLKELASLRSENIHLAYPYGAIAPISQNHYSRANSTNSRPSAPAHH